MSLAGLRKDGGWRVIICCIINIITNVAVVQSDCLGLSLKADQ
jgi:hypothetical protein